MEFLPLFLNLREQDCIIVGGGEVALRKAILLIRAKANLTLVSPQFVSQLQDFSKEGKCKLVQEEFAPEQLEGARIVIAATDNQKVNIRVANSANKKNLPVNVVDQPKLCSFIMPSIVDRSPVIVAISSSGRSPILTRKIKELNESLISNREGQLAELLGTYRGKVREKFPGFTERLKFWESLLESELSELVYSGNENVASKLIEDRLQQPDQAEASGEVYLVGAGPGDPDLLTLRALRLMHKADVVLYDRLVSEEIMSKLRPDAEKIHVGKASANHPVKQETINEMLVRLARSGNRVLRLKGGDPFIFGRGGEEIESLAKANVPFQIIPGITAASGCASYAGIPLTHRDHAQSVRFLTGHLKNNTLNLDWANLVQKHETLVFYMGLLGIKTICEQLIEYGMDSEMPIAVVQQGTTKTQRVVTADLKTMPAVADNEKLKAPTIIIIGRVVGLRDSLNWYQS